MSDKVRIKDDDKKWQKLKDEVQKLGGGRVTIGVHGKAGKTKDGDLTMANLAAVHEFGVTIQHPGGTPYKFGPSGEVIFTSKGDEEAVGVTEPHEIVIPERSFIRSTIDENVEEYGRIIAALMAQWATLKRDRASVYKVIGMKITADIRNKTITLKDPPNAASTIRRKGSSNPLRDSGRLGNSVDYIVKE